MQASPVSQWMAAWAVQYRNMTVAAACRALTKAKKTWGFGLCYLHLRNVRGFGWNHKRPLGGASLACRAMVYRIYRELELNMRIKPRKRLRREKPDALSVPEAPNHVWAAQRNIELMYIQPPLGVALQHLSAMGKPQQNAYVERYNRTVRQEWLGRYLFDTLEQVQEHATRWLWSYNNERPNMGIGGITPAQKLKQAA